MSSQLYGKSTACGGGSGVGGRNVGIDERGRGTIADQEKREVVGLACATRKILDGFEHRFLELVERRIGVPVEQVAKTRDAKKFFGGIPGFGDAVAEERSEERRV